MNVQRLLVRCLSTALLLVFTSSCETRDELGPDASDVPLDAAVGEVDEADAASTEPPRLRIVTANISFSISAAKVKNDWESYSEKADIVLMQEARDVTLNTIIDTNIWAVRQDTSSEAKRGSAIVVRKSIANSGGIGSLALIEGVGASGCPNGGINARYIARVDVDLKEGGTVKLASLHMPPKRCWGPVYDAMADSVVSMINSTPGKLIVAADWNKVVVTDPNNIKSRTGDRLEIRAPEGSIDGFYFRPSAFVDNEYLRPRLWSEDDAKRMPATNSDHRPVRWVVTVH